jgi:hypothetical protein
MKRPSLLFGIIGFAFIILPIRVRGQASTQPSGGTPSKAAASQPASSAADWKVTKEKAYPSYKVQILTKANPSSPLGIEGTRAVITNLQGKVLTEVKSLFIEPDPRETVEGFTPGTTSLDLDGDGTEDLILRLFTGGTHCCYSYQIYSLGKVFKKIGDLKLLDCGSKIRIHDIDQDGMQEILTCNAGFTYLKDLSFAQSPFPPMVFGLEGGRYVDQDKKFSSVFDHDISEQKKMIQEKKASDGDIIQIILDYFLTGRESEGWSQFDKLYTSANKEKVRENLKERWERYLGIRPQTQPAETKASETVRSDAGVQ